MPPRLFFRVKFSQIQLLSPSSRHSFNSFAMLFCSTPCRMLCALPHKFGCPSGIAEAKPRCSLIRPIEMLVKHISCPNVRSNESFYLKTFESLESFSLESLHSNGFHLKVSIRNSSFESFHLKLSIWKPPFKTLNGTVYLDLFLRET